MPNWVSSARPDGNRAFDGHGFQVHTGPNKPKSRGQVAITSRDPRHPPEIQFNYLHHEEDRRDWRACIRLTREILGQPALDKFRGEEIQPGLEVATDEQIDAWVRANVESAYHPSCTCKMGNPDEAMTVVDPKCRVVGITGLRVVDSSIFPVITNGNLNGPTIMVGEKAADMILGKDPLPASNAPVWVDPQWQTRQRQGEPLRPLP